MLRNENLKLRLRENVKCSGRGVFSLRRHTLNEQEVLLRLKITQVTMRDSRENDLAIRGVARKAPQQLAAIEEEVWRVAEVPELFPETWHVNFTLGLCFFPEVVEGGRLYTNLSFVESVGLEVINRLNFSVQIEWAGGILPRGDRRAQQQHTDSPANSGSLHALPRSLWRI